MHFAAPKQASGQVGAKETLLAKQNDRENKTARLGAKQPAFDPVLGAEGLS